MHLSERAESDPAALIDDGTCDFVGPCDDSRRGTETTTAMWTQPTCSDCCPSWDTCAAFSTDWLWRKTPGTPGSDTKKAPHIEGLFVVSWPKPPFAIQVRVIMWSWDSLRHDIHKLYLDGP